MRILFWPELFWPYIGGVEVLAAELLPALSERGHDITVITSVGPSDLPAEDEFRGIRVVRLPFRSALTAGDPAEIIAVRRRLGQVLRETEPDVLHHFGMGATTLFVRDIVYAHPVPLLISLHHSLHGQVAAGTAGLVPQVLRSADWVAACSAGVLEDARRAVPEIGPVSSTVYNGLSVPKIAPSDLPFDPPTLMCLGRLAPEKGFDLALAALGSLAGRDPALRLVIAGDGAERAGLERQAAALDIRDRVDFLGMVPPDSVPEHLNGATIVLVPSRMEGFGIAALQSAQMARPVVATRAGGLPEVVEHGRTGLIVGTENEESLVQAIARLLDHPEEAVALGQAARERALATFTLERCVDGYDSLYRKLRSRRGPKAGRAEVSAEGGTLAASPGSGDGQRAVPSGGPPQAGSTC